MNESREDQLQYNLFSPPQSSF